MVFDWDQERDANAVQTILKDHKPLLIGPRIMNDSGFMLGPYFFYLLAPFYLLVNFHPYAIIVLVAIYYLAFFILSFLTIKKSINEKTAIIFCCIWGLLPLAINIDTMAWNPLLVPLFMILFINYLSMEPSFKLGFWFVFGLIIGLAINMHVQLAILIPWFFFYFANKKELKTSVRYFTFVGLGILVTLLPLIIFDLRHNWINLGLFLSFLQSSNIQKHVLSFIPVWNNFVSGLIGFYNPNLSILLWLTVGAIFVQFSKGNKILRSISILWLVWPIAFILYGKRPSEYYFNFTLPLIILAISILFSKILKNTAIIIAVFILFAIPAVNYRITKNKTTPFSLTNKMLAADFIKSKVEDKKFNLSYSVPAGYNSGYEFLLERAGAVPTNNPSDPLIQIVIPPVPGNEVFGGIGIQLPQTFLQ